MHYTPRIPSYNDHLSAQRYLDATSHHKCGVCEHGDCSTVISRDEAYAIVGAYRAGVTIEPSHNSLFLSFYAPR